jgi:hypothetical protein
MYSLRTMSAAVLILMLFLTACSMAHKKTNNGAAYLTTCPDGQELYSVDNMCYPACQAGYEFATDSTQTPPPCVQIATDSDLALPIVSYSMDAGGQTATVTIELADEDSTITSFYYRKYDYQVDNPMISTTNGNAHPCPVRDCKLTIFGGTSYIYALSYNGKALSVFKQGGVYPDLGTGWYGPIKITSSDPYTNYCNIYCAKMMTPGDPCVKNCVAACNTVGAGCPVPTNCGTGCCSCNVPPSPPSTTPACNSCCAPATTPKKVLAEMWAATPPWNVNGLGSTSPIPGGTHFSVHDTDNYTCQVASGKTSAACELYIPKGLFDEPTHYWKTTNNLEFNDQGPKFYAWSSETSPAINDVTVDRIKYEPIVGNGSTHPLLTKDNLQSGTTPYGTPPSPTPPARPYYYNWYGHQYFDDSGYTPTGKTGPVYIYYRWWVEEQ